MGSTSIWYWRTQPPMLATSATPDTEFSWYWMNQSCRECNVPPSYGPSTVYQKTWPTPVASGPRTGTTPSGRKPDARLSRSKTRVRAKYGSILSWKMMLIIEKPNAEEERTSLTPAKPCKFTVNGYVI